MIQTVYVVSMGEDHEGVSIYGVFKRKLKAIKKAESMMNQRLEWKMIHKSDDYVAWRCGCDVLSVKKHKVE
jgi:hypothetical protein